MKSFKTIEGGTFLLNSRAYMYWSSLLDKQVYGTEIHVHQETYFHSFYNMQKIRWKKTQSKFIWPKASKNGLFKKAVNTFA